MKRTLALFLLFFIFCGKDKSVVTNVNKQNFKQLVETGELQAVNSKHIQMPTFNWSYGEPKIVKMIEEGARVKKGDFVLQIDTSGVVKELGQKRTELEIAQAELLRMYVEQENQIKSEKADLQSAKAAFEQAAFDTIRVRFESAVKKEKQRLLFKIAQIDYDNNISKIKHTGIIQKESILIQKKEIKQLESAIDKAILAKERFTLKAPSDGIVEYLRRRWRSHEKFKVGDTAHPGEALIGLPDLNRMKVLTSISEADINKIYLNQSVTIRLDAFPKLKFSGKVLDISKTCHEKEENSLIKVFDVEILLEETSSIQKPGMTVSCVFNDEKS